MKQSNLLRCSEAAERARFSLLADEDPARIRFTTISTSPPPFDLTSLRQQLFLDGAVRRLSRITRLRPAN